MVCLSAITAHERVGVVSTLTLNFAKMRTPDELSIIVGSKMSPRKKNALSSKIGAGWAFKANIKVSRFVTFRHKRHHPHVLPLAHDL